MRHNFLLTLSILLGLVSNRATASDNVLWYNKPATIWQEALPLGNGRIGAMVYGGIDTEEIQLNEETMWGGGPHNNVRTISPDTLSLVRKMIFEGKEHVAHDMINRNFMTGQNGMPYETIGSLIISPCKMFKQNPEPNHIVPGSYRRSLDLSKALSTTTYKIDDVTFRREVITSFADNVVIIHITADKKGSISFSASYRSPLRHTVNQDHGLLAMCGYGADHEGIKGAVRSMTLTEVKAPGGLVFVDDTMINVVNANEATIYVSIATNFINYHDVSGNEQQKCFDFLRNATIYTYAQSLNRHIKRFAKQFNRVKLSISNPSQPFADIPTDSLLRIASSNNNSELPIPNCPLSPIHCQLSLINSYLLPLLFQYGRYLLICSSQPGGQAANLQGIWNNQLNAPWDGKYTININTEMNYWPAQTCNLAETEEPLVQLIKDLSQTGKQSARLMYGAQGYMAHHNTDIWCSTGMVDGATWGIWPHGAGWLSTYLWERYLFSGDKKFLKSVYPQLKGAADFYLTSMVVDPRNGYLVVAPSISPEHGPNGKPSVTAGCTMDNQIVRDVLTYTRQATEILYATSKQNYIDSLNTALSQLPPMKVGKYGQLQEWIDDVDDPNDQHRHVSHAYGLFPSHQISPFTTPDLCKAMRTTLLQRGDEATGWSIGWKINLWARLLDGNHAYKLIRALTNILPSDSEIEKYPHGRMYPNLFDAHPPFQIDGNFGFTAGVAEMLLQSHDGFIHFLPALPDAWSEGTVSGLCARGGIVVSESWQHNHLLSATVTSKSSQTIRLRSYVPLSGQKLTLTKHIEKEPISGKPIYEYTLSVSKGKTYKIFI